MQHIEKRFQSILFPNTLLKQIFLIFSGALLLSIASQISIPLRPVPLTFQSATVILIGMSYGARYGSLAILTYLVAGLSGLPVFADFSGGLNPFFGPTVGYLVGFFPAAWVSGYLVQRGWGQNFLSSFMVACISANIIFALGIAVLTQYIGFEKAILFGLMPFIYTEIIKLAMVALFIPHMWKPKN